MRWVFLNFLLFSPTVFGAATLMVDPGGGGDFTTVQAAIDAANDGDTVLVKPGEYVIEESIDFNRLHDPSPPLKNIVVKSEGGLEVTTIRMGKPKDSTRASVVTFGSGEGTSSVLEGFTLTGGRTKGGGILCLNGSSPMIVNCKILGNTAGSGGGVFCGSGASPLLKDCAIMGNSAEDGAGVACENASPTLSGCVISGNGAGESGAGVDCRQGSSPTLTHCTIVGNSASERGGGVHCEGNSSPMLMDCMISRNSAGESGGGVSCRLMASPTLTRCTISNNWSAMWGGGVSCEAASRPTLDGCTISGNWGSPFGGGVLSMGSFPWLLNCEVSGNSADDRGGGMSCQAGSLATLANCTISGNAAGRGGGGLDLGGPDCGGDSSASLTNCIVWGNSPEEDPCGSLDHCLWDTDPLFVSEGVFDFGRRTSIEVLGKRYPVPDFIVEQPDHHLRPDSPAIDSATPDGAPATDIEGNPRPCWGGVDVGAYESCPPVPFRRVDTDGDGELTITDVIRLLSYLFLGEEAPGCLDAADANGSESLDLSDAVYSLWFLFMGGLQPKAPFPGCGTYESPGRLGCRQYPACP